MTCMGEAFAGATRPDAAVIAKMMVANVVLMNVLFWMPMIFFPDGYAAVFVDWN